MTIVIGGILEEFLSSGSEFSTATLANAPRESDNPHDFHSTHTSQQMTTPYLSLTWSSHAGFVVGGENVGADVVG